MDSAKKKVLLTLLSSLTVQLCNIFVSLVIPKVIISIYGSDTNGIVAAARQFSLYLSLMETSITAATCYKYIEYKKNGELDLISDLFETIGNFYKKVGIVISVIAIFIAIFYSVTSKSELNVITIILLFILYESIYVISYLVYYKYNYVLFADGKQYFIAFGSVASIFLTTISQCFLAYKRFNIVFLISCGVFIDVFRLEINRRKVLHDYPFIQHRKSKIDNGLLKQKWDSFIMSISDSLKSMVPILCISIGYGSQYVSVFSVYQTVMHLGTSIITMCSNGLLPVLGLKFTDGDEMASKSFRKISVIVLTVGTVLTTCFSGMILNFINLYIGNKSDISYSYPILALLLIADTWLLMARAPYDLLIKAKGRIRELRNGCIVEISITVLVCIIMSLSKNFELIIIGIAISSFYRVLRMLLFCVNELKIIQRKVALVDFFSWLIIALFMGGVSFRLLPSTVGIIEFIKYSSIELFISVLFVVLLLGIFYRRLFSVKDFRKSTE